MENGPFRLEIEIRNKGCVGNEFNTVKTWAVLGGAWAHLRTHNRIDTTMW